MRYFSSFCLFWIILYSVEWQNSLLCPLNMLKNHLLAQILLNISIGTYSFMKTIYPVLHSGLQLNTSMQIITSFHISPQAGTRQWSKNRGLLYVSLTCRFQIDVHTTVCSCLGYHFVFIMNFKDPNQHWQSEKMPVVFSRWLWCLQRDFWRWQSDTGTSSISPVIKSIVAKTKISKPFQWYYWFIKNIIWQPEAELHEIYNNKSTFKTHRKYNDKT